MRATTTRATRGAQLCHAVQVGVLRCGRQQVTLIRALRGHRSTVCSGYNEQTSLSYCDSGTSGIVALSLDTSAPPSQSSSDFKSNVDIGPPLRSFWFYGDDPIDARLAKLNEYLQDYEPHDDVQSLVPEQPLFREPRTTVGYYAAGEEQVPSWLRPLASFLSKIGVLPRLVCRV
jgi:hypothetical protein